MSAGKFVFASGSAAAVALLLALAQIRAAREARQELASARMEVAHLENELATWTKKVDEAERRALGAERDTAELLTAVNAMRAQASAAPAGSLRPAKASGARNQTAPGPEAIDTTALRAQRAMVARSAGVTSALQVRAAIGAPLDAEDQVVLAQERRYQQELAQQRAAEAKERANFDQELSRLTPAEKYDQLVGRAQRQATAGSFAEAIRTFNEAWRLKPTEVAVSPAVADLKALLVAQNQPLDVALVSDGQTFVSIRNARAPERFARVAVTLLPGDYEVVGRRAGYQEIIVPLRLRSGLPVPNVTVICDTPVAPEPSR